MKTLRAADSADAIVEGLRWRREPRATARRRCARSAVSTSRLRAASSASSNARSAATRSPKSSTPRHARTTGRRRGGRCPNWWPKRSPTTRPPSGASSAWPPQTPTRQPHLSQTPRTRPRPARRHHLRERTRQAATRSAQTTNALLPSKRPGERPPDARKWTARESAGIGRADARNPIGAGAPSCPEVVLLGHTRTASVAGVGMTRGVGAGRSSAGVCGRI